MPLTTARPTRIAARWLQAITTPLPVSFETTERGLMTLAEFIKHRNPQGKFHDEDSYDWTTESMNRKLIPIREDKGFLISKPLGKTGYLIHQDGRLVAFIHQGTMYFGAGAPIRDIPTSYYDYHTRDFVDLGVQRKKRVKYIDEHVDLVYQIAASNYSEYPVIVQRFRVKGEPYVLRAQAEPVPDKGINLGLFNEAGEKVASAENEWGATLLVVAREYRGKGLGKIIGKAWYHFNPSFPSGGFSAAGQDNAVRLWADRVREFLSRGWYSELVRSGQLTPARVKEILADLPGKKRRQTEAPQGEKKQVLFMIDDPTFVIYDQRFLSEPDEKYIYAYGFFRDAPGIGEFLYTIDYDRTFDRVAHVVAFQMARDNGLDLYVGEGYGDMLEMDKVPEIEVEGDYARLTQDMLPLDPLGRREKLLRKRVDPYEEKYTRLLEMAEAKWR